ncbi:9014_t:CDS:2, partial [Gigaspora rosea]
RKKKSKKKKLKIAKDLLQSNDSSSLDEDKIAKIKDEESQNTISTEILSISTAISSENFNQIEKKTLYPESTTPLNAEIKKRRSKSRSKSVRISDRIPINNSDVVISTLNETEK